MTIFVGDTANWEIPAHRVGEKAREFIRNDFGDRLMIWNEMANLLVEKGVPKEYLPLICSGHIGYYNEMEYLFLAEIKESLTKGSSPVMDVEEFEKYIEENNGLIRDHRVINTDSPEKREKIRTVFLEAWNTER